MSWISPTELTIQPLDKLPFDFVQGFSCGNPLINDYLKTHYCALRDHQLGIASTSVVLFENNVVAFFTASCTQVEIPVEESKQLGIDDLYVPAIEVKFLAVSQGYQGRGIGTILLSLVVSEAYKLSAMFACRYIFLWSVPEDRALRLYTDHYFIDTGTRNADGSHLMMFQLPNDLEDEEY